MKPIRIVAAWERPSRRRVDVAEIVRVVTADERVGYRCYCGRCRRVRTAELGYAATTAAERAKAKRVVLADSPKRCRCPDGAQPC